MPPASRTAIAGPEGGLTLETTLAVRALLRALAVGARFRGTLAVRLGGASVLLALRGRGLVRGWRWRCLPSSAPGICVRPLPLLHIGPPRAAIRRASRVRAAFRRRGSVHARRRGPGRGHEARRRRRCRRSGGGDAFSPQRRREVVWRARRHDLAGLEGRRWPRGRAAGRREARGARPDLERAAHRRELTHLAGARPRDLERPVTEAVGRDADDRVR